MFLINKLLVEKCIASLIRKTVSINRDLGKFLGQDKDLFLFSVKLTLTKRLRVYLFILLLKYVHHPPKNLNLKQSMSLKKMFLCFELNPVADRHSALPQEKKIICNNNNSTVHFIFLKFPHFV